MIENRKKYPNGNAGLAYLRLSLGLSQRQFGEVIGTDQPHISNVEAGRARLGVGVALKIVEEFRETMEALDLTLEDLLRGEAP